MTQELYYSTFESTLLSPTCQDDDIKTLKATVNQLDRSGDLCPPKP